MQVFNFYLNFKENIQIQNTQVKLLNNVAINQVLVICFLTQSVIFIKNAFALFAKTMK